MIRGFKGALIGSLAVLVAESFMLGAYAQGNPAAIAAEESAQQAAATAAIAAEESAQQAAATAAIAAEEAAQQAAATAAIAAEEAAQQAAATAAIAAEEAAQQAAATAAIAAEEAAQQAAATAAIAAEEAAQQAAATASIAAEEAAQQAAATAAIAAEESAQQAAATAAIAAEESAQQAAATAAIAAEESAHSAEMAAASLHFGSGETLFASTNESHIEIQVGGSLNPEGVVAGGTARTIAPGEMLTAAELEAVQQVLSGGVQRLVLNEHGHAVDGHAIVLPSELQHGIQDIFVPEAVSLSLINFNSSSPLNISGNADVLGSVFAFHDTAGVESVLNLGSLDIASSGLLSGSVANPSIFSSYFPSSSLSLNVVNNVVNAGAIVSPGSLAVTTGGAINNTGFMTGQSVTLNAGQGITNSSQILATAGNVNLNSAIGSFTNSGIISAAIGNINIATQQASHIALDNAGGLFEAPGGAINVRDESFTGKYDLTFAGGNYLAEEINLYSGNGHVSGYIDRADGIVNIVGHETHLTSLSDLTLGSVINTGDPLFLIVGDFTLVGGPFLFGETISALATNNFTIDGVSIQAGNAAQGFDITFLAGGSFPFPPIGPTTTFTPTSGALGGDLLLINGTTISTSPTAGGVGVRPGGNVLLAAYRGNGVGGTVDFSQATINTTGLGGGQAGNVSIFGRTGAGLTAVNAGVVTANTGAGITDVAFIAGSPIFAGFTDSPTFSNLTGALLTPLTGASITPGVVRIAQPTNSVINGRFRAVTDNSGSVMHIGTGNIVTTNSISVDTGSMLFFSTGNFTATTNTVTINAFGNIVDLGTTDVIVANAAFLRSTSGVISGAAGNDPLNINVNLGRFNAALNSLVRNQGDIELVDTQSATNGIYRLTAVGGSIRDSVGPPATRLITADTVRLRTVGPGGGSIGTLARPIRTNANNLAIVMLGGPGGPGAGRNAFVDETDSINLLQSNAVNALVVSTGFISATGGDLTVVGQIDARTIVLDAFQGTVFAGDVNINAPLNQIVPTGLSPGILIGSDNNVNINSPITALRFIDITTEPDGNDINVNALVRTTALAGPSLIFLESNDDIELNALLAVNMPQVNLLGAIFLDADDNIRGNGLVRGFFLDAFARDDHIGVSAADRVNTDAIAATFNAPNGDVFVREIGALNVTLDSSALGTFDLLAVAGIIPFNFTATGNITAGNIVLNSAHIIDILGDLTANTGDISITAGNLASLGPIILPAFFPTIRADNGSVIVTAPTIFVGIGGGNVTVSAGSAAPAGTNGSILLNATGAGGIQISEGHSFTSNGGNLVAGVQGAGHIGLTSVGPIAMGNANTFTATGGDIWFSSQGDITIINGNTATSTFVLDPNGGVIVAATGTVPNHVGGRIAIGADGTLPANVPAFLAGLVGQRAFVNAAGLPGSNTVNIANGPFYNAIGPLAGVTGNIFNALGGVIVVDPPAVTGSTFTAIGPPLTPFPVPPPPPPVIPTGGGASGAATTAGAGASGRDVLFEVIGSKIPIDQTRILEGAVEADVPYKPVQPTRYIKAVRTSSSRFSPGELARLEKQGVQLATGSRDGVLSINKGNVLVNPDRDIVVNHPDGRTYVPKGAMVLFLETGADIAILDLHQGSPRPVRTVAEGKLITMHPGKMLVLSRQEGSDLEDLDHECKIIGHRKASHSELSDKLHAFKTDFSIPSAMMKVLPLKKMFSSGNSRDKRMVDKLLMNALLLREGVPYKGPFMQTALINQ